MAMASEAETGSRRRWRASPFSRAGVDVASEPSARRYRWLGALAVKRSPLARRIIVSNLLAMLVLAAGVLLLDPFRESLVYQREASLIAEAELVADVFEVQLLQAPEARFGEGLDPEGTLAALDLSPLSDIFVFDHARRLVATSRGADRSPEGRPAGAEHDPRHTIISDTLDGFWVALRSVFPAGGDDPVDARETRRLADSLVARTYNGGTQLETGLVENGSSIFAVTTPIEHETGVLGVVALTSGAGEIDRLVRAEREQVLQMFVIATLVSVGLSLILAATIANPLSDLAAAAEIGHDRSHRSVRPSRVRIPDLGQRSDEIGRLSSAMRGMVAALYDRIDANEQFAADVAHEIKNPLASLRSAVGSLRVVTGANQRQTLLDVIEHDVRRLDRLVSDISNASRLDSELVKEEEESFDLLAMLSGLADHLGRQAREKGVDLVTDLPPEPIVVDGLESRLAQVFANLIGNAISFCEAGDAIRIWVRRRENRVLAVVEDTGPGIPEAGLTKIFARFYSERPEGQFGNNSGLGLAISKQIVEAHGGVIWAENIQPTDADPTSDPLGARFVVGLPV